MEVMALALISALCLRVTSVAGYIFYGTSFIQLISQYSVVTPGERVEFKCSGTYCSDDRTAYLYRNGFSIKSQHFLCPSSVIFTLSIVNVFNAGHYTCAFSSQHSQSSSISITVVVLQKPIVSLETRKEVAWGQSVQMRCSILTAYKYQGGTFALQQRSGSFRKTIRVFQNSALFTIPKVNFIHEGAYYCQYQKTVTGRDITSPQSDTVSFSVIVVLVQPHISVSAPNGGLFWGSLGPEVTRGHSLSLICSTEPQYQGGSFHLIFDGSNRTRTRLAVNHSASFYIPEADYPHQGNYSSVYEVTLSTRTFNSTQTAPLTITVRASLSPIIAFGVISGLFLLLVVPAILHLVKKILTDTSHGNTGPLTSSSPSRSVSRYAFSTGPGGSDEDNSIYMNTAVHPVQPDCGEDTGGDTEEVYVNAEAIRNCSMTIGNYYKEDAIYKND